jgi:hypothetical protein
MAILSVVNRAFTIGVGAYTANTFGGAISDRLLPMQPAGVLLLPGPTIASLSELRASRILVAESPVTARRSSKRIA